MKKLQHIKIFLCGAFLLTLLSLCACSDFLDRTPGNQQSQESFWKKQGDAESWMYGVYGRLQTALMGSVVHWGDGRTDNFHPTPYGSGATMQLNLIKSSNGQANWTDLYAVINSCNIALEKLPGMSFDDNLKKSLMGQCHGLRALMYFYIARLWGDAPLVLKSWDGNIATKYNSRTPIADIAIAIENDVKESIQLLHGLPESNKLSGVYYFNIAAAYALQADFLAWQGRYSEIATVWENLNKLGTHSLITNPNDWNVIFSNPSASQETIFTIGFNKENSPTTERTDYASTIGYSSSNPAYALSKEMYLNMVRDTIDVRMLSTIARSDIKGALIPESAPVYNATSSGGLNEVRTIKKCWPMGPQLGTFITSTTEFLFELPVYRYVDVMLLYAEALNHEGDGEGAIRILNEVRASRGAVVFADIDDYPKQFGNTNDSREKLIMDERQLEFFVEGKRWFDLQRTDWIMDVLDEHVRHIQAIRGDDVIGFTDSNYLLWPIYINVTVANPKIKQNAGY